jgi:peptidoglycan hydrolase-like protein with peptidoglycan-binding domain
MKKHMVLVAPVILLAGCGLFGREAGRPPSDDALANRNSRPATQAAASQDVAEAQQALKAAGFDPGSADGVLGPQTRQAIRDFQRARGVPVTGELDRETQRALRAQMEAPKPGGGQ